MAIVSPSSSSYENESLKEMIVAVGGAENLGAETPPSRVREAKEAKWSIQPNDIQLKLKNIHFGKLVMMHKTPP